jgi:endonuclease YncB( thermonuclease family)
MPLLWIVLLLVASCPALADDADTLTVGGIRYRLDGIDAPELDQVCIDHRGNPYTCGRRALDALQDLVAGRR